MKKRVLLVVLLVICLSSHLSAETLDSGLSLDCELSFEVGKIAAKEYKACGWYWLGIGAGIAELYFSWLLGEYCLVDQYGVAAVAVGGATNVAGILLSWAFPLPNRIVPSSSDVDLECYRRGYRQITTGRNYGAFVLGQLTTGLVSLAVVAYMGAMN